MTVARPTRRSVLTQALGRSGLRRLALVFACFRTAEMGAWIAITTVAFERGGVDEASAVVVAQLGPAALAALAVSGVARRVGPGRVLAGGLALQCTALAGIATLLAVGAPIGAVYALAVLGAISVVTTRPTLATLLPSVVGDPHELTAANALVGWLDGVSTLLGPVITALGLALIGPAAPFAVFAALCAVGWARGRTISRESGTVGPPPPPWAAAGVEGTDPPADDRGTIVGRSGEQRTPTDRGGVLMVLVVLAASAFLIGALDVLFVVIAVDVTAGPPARAAWLNTAFGLGALVGGAASTLLIGIRRLWPVVVGSALVAAATLVVVGATTGPLQVAVTLGFCGVAGAALVVSARTLLQRLCDLQSLCRAFSLAESSEMAMLLVGSLAVPFLVAGLGARWSPAGVASVVAVVALAAAVPLARAERGAATPFERITQIRAVELFSLLPAPTLETLARQAVPMAFQPGAAVLVEGGDGDRYYVVTDGQVEVSCRGTVLRRLGPGTGFGELALLYDVPRTATVVAVTPVALLSIDRTSFLVAVTGHEPTQDRAHRTARGLIEAPDLHDVDPGRPVRRSPFRGGS